MMLQRNHPCGADLEEWGFKTRDISFGTLKCLENIRLGLLPSHQYRCRIDAHLAASHIVSDVTIHRKDQTGACQTTPHDTPGTKSSFFTYNDYSLSERFQMKYYSMPLSSIMILPLDPFGL
ncbi:hypothetical protein SK128_017549 [Halocaridina rubra]|uniref:Uncharacterized protein n=1 Tax=Halocaridina rubra TaxID=373956 RepID=A0AAN8XT15_HALRR